MGGLADTRDAERMLELDVENETQATLLADLFSEGDGAVQVGSPETDLSDLPSFQHNMDVLDGLKYKHGLVISREEICRLNIGHSTCCGGIQRQKLKRWHRQRLREGWDRLDVGTGSTGQARRGLGMAQNASAYDFATHRLVQARCTAPERPRWGYSKGSTLLWSVDVGTEVPGCYSTRASGRSGRGVCPAVSCGLAPRALEGGHCQVVGWCPGSGCWNLGSALLRPPSGLCAVQGNGRVCKKKRIPFAKQCSHGSRAGTNRSRWPP
jgi:hypothetical protein